MQYILRVVGLLSVFTLCMFTASGQSQQPGYVPPDVVEYGLQVHNQHLAVIQSNCATIDEAVTLRDELVRNGALVSIFTSPQFMLAWVPPEAKSAVLASKVSSVTGSIGVVGVSYSSAEFRSQLGTNQTMAALNEADEAILEYIDFIKQPLSEADKERIRKAEEEINQRSALMPPLDCVQEFKIDEPAPYDLHSGIPSIDVNDPQVMSHATKVRGYVVHTSFFVESKAGTGTWNWDVNVYNRYRNLYVAAMNYWTSFTARYGRTLTTYWRLFSSTNSNCQVTGEPTTIGEDVFIPEIVRKFYFPFFWDMPPAWSWAGDGMKYAWWYNQKIRSSFNADDVICSFIAYKPTVGEAIWPHANSVVWSDGKREGVYCTLDTQYWQAGLDPFSSPMRNVIAHEIGHLFGAPDEYRNDNCNWTYRGLKNVNCQTTQSAYGRSGFNMRGWDGIMVANYVGGNSLATPVHTGVISSSEAVPTRLFQSTPTGAALTFRNCDNIRTQSLTAPIAVPMDFDYCHTVTVPAKRTVSGVSWYFDYWEITRKNGTTTKVDYNANELKSSSYSSTFSNPVKDVRVVYTNSPPDFLTANTTLKADLAPNGTTASPAPAIALRWKNKYDMSKVTTQIEYEVSTGNWKSLSSGQHFSMSPFHVPINQWTGVLITSVPLVSGTGGDGIKANREYRFRIVGYFNTNRGTNSQVASVKTRPASPPDTVYCYDANEPNNSSSPKVLPSSGSGMSPYTMKGAIPIAAGYTGEFSWFNPANDYYRITVINLKGNSFSGDVVRLSLRVRPGSDFEPDFQAQRVGVPTYISAAKSGDTRVLSLSTDGEYLIKVGSKISQSVSYDLVDRTGGHYAFGEYEFTVERRYGAIFLPICENCFKLKVVHPFPGELIFDPHPPFALLTQGVNRMDSLQFKISYIPPPGFGFLGFGGDLGDIKVNPVLYGVGPHTTPGEFEFYPMLAAIDGNTAELVIIYPEGPGGPIDGRQSTSIGSTLIAEAKPPEGFVFVGWGGDTTAVTNPLSVTMWKNKKLIAHYREKPCKPEPMTEWKHTLNFVNSRQAQLELIYAMQANAGDGLEPGQVDLPPVPPPTAFDIRFLNITGSQGSVTDFRAIKPSHTFQGRVQTGPTNPVQMSWATLPSTPNASFTLRIQGMSGSIDMRTQSSYTFSDEGVYLFTIEVKEAACPEPTKENDVDVTTEDIDTRDWPCIKLRLKLRSRATGDFVPYYNPYKLRFAEKQSDGSRNLLSGQEFTQLDSLLIVRLCLDPDKPGRDREVEVVNKNDDDPEQEEDTTKVRVTVPLPEGDGDPTKVVWKIPGDWQMVSLPVNSAVGSPVSLFNDPSLSIFYFNTDDGVYDVVNEIEFGKGYWIRSNGLDGVVYGLEQNTLTLEGLSGIGEPNGFGWNMVGAPSKSLAVSSVTVSPANGLKSVFGWDPNSGYIIPTTIEPGKGYWVRVDPNTKLVMQGSAFTGNGSTAYSKTVDRLDIAGMLQLSVDGQGLRPLYVSATMLRAEERDDLALPAPPPGVGFDVRTAEQAQYVFPGENTIRVYARGTVQIAIPADMPRVTIAVLTAEGRELGHLTGSAGEKLMLPVDGNETILLHVSVRPLSGSDDLGINYPNPFQIGSETWIPYTLHQDGEVRLAVYDLLGRRLSTLVSSSQQAGEKIVSWNGRDMDGELLPAGMYVYRLETAAGIVTRTLTIVR